MKRPCVKNLVLKGFIKGLGMKQPMFARALGLPASRVQNWINGSRPIRQENVDFIHQVFGVNDPLRPEDVGPEYAAHPSGSTTKLWDTISREYRVESLCQYLRICLMEATESDSDWQTRRAKAVFLTLLKAIQDAERRFDLRRFRSRVKASATVREGGDLIANLLAAAWAKHRIEQKACLSPAQTSQAPRVTPRSAG